ncbi:MAG: ABC transporter permease subunit [Anaerolineae bacterium]|nr:ABC transporter permease subunit [Anaerolineae bacterium]
MVGITFIEQLKHSWRQILYWGGGLALLVMFVMSIMQDVAVPQQYAEMLEQFPPAMLNAYGLSDAAAIATPDGFVSFAALTYGTIALAIFAVVAGLSVTANDEDAGIMNVLLALPIPRWRIIVERTAAYALIMVAIAMLEFVGMFCGTFLIPDDITIDLSKLFLGSLNLIPGSLTLFAATIFFASIFSRKIIATGSATALVLGSYILNILAEVVTEDSFGYFLGRFSVWKYFGTPISRPQWSELYEYHRLTATCNWASGNINNRF